MSKPLLRWPQRTTGGGILPLALALLLGLGVLWSPLHGADLTQQRKDFLAAEQALRQGDSASYIPLRAKLLDYPLFAYLEYAETLGKGPQQVEAFVHKYPDGPLAYDLRRDHLKQLAAANNWADFLRIWRDTSNIEMQCLHLQALLASDKATQAYKAGARIWLYGDSRPDSCDPVFEQMQQAGKLSRALVWERIDLVRAGNSDQRSGLIRYLRRFLPATDHAWHDLWLHSLNQPERVLQSPLLKKKHPSRGNLLVHAIIKQGWRKPDAALAAWRRATARHWLDPAQKKRIQLGLGKALVRRDHAKTMKFFAEVEHCHQIEGLCELRVDYALQRRDWKRLISWVNDMPRVLRQHEKWGYWKARALEHLGRNKEAQELFRQVAGDRSYYGFMAADRVGADYRLDHRPVPLQALGKVSALDGVQRAHELYRLGREYQAAREWNWVIDQLDREELMAAAHLARQWGWDERAILTLLG
ncbi:MAG: hypothetical protein H7842_05285, partial [Gammaproteobacteria bacterium SHHR-1]